MTRVQDAVLHLLCFGTTYDRVADYPGRNGVGGLFSQLNFLAQEVLERLYQGRTPAATCDAGLCRPRSRRDEHIDLLEAKKVLL